ncbi:hypothetical protein BDV12DRAFT_208115 [Aspergillus spectabilis]
MAGLTLDQILSSHYNSAIGHIRSGIKIFNEVRYDPNSGIFCYPFLKPSMVTNLEMENLLRMLIRLQDQAFTLTRDDIDRQLLHPLPTRHPGYIEIPEMFRSIAEARDIYEYYHCKFTRDLHEIISDEQQFISFQHFKLGKATQSSWDRFNPMFEEIVTLAASVVDSTHGIECLSLSPSQLAELPKGGHVRPSFSLNMDIVSSMSDVAALCRDPVIRRQAVRVLRSASVQEGVFNSHVCAVLAERIIAIEETVALGKTLDYQTELTSLSLLSGGRGERKGEIRKARLSYAYPTVDTPIRKYS